MTDEIHKLTQTATEKFRECISDVCLWRFEKTPLESGSPFSPSNASALQLCSWEWQLDAEPTNFQFPITKPDSEDAF